MLSERILYFSGKEDIDEILEKIRESKSDSLSLVFPIKSNIFEQKTDLQKLRDFIDNTEKNIIFITQNNLVIKELQNIGISALKNLPEKFPLNKSKNSINLLNISYIPIDDSYYDKQKNTNEAPQPIISRPSLHAIFILATITLLLFIFIINVIIPEANIIIYPTKKEEEMHINVNFLDKTLFKESELWTYNNGIFMTPLESTFTHSNRFTNISKEFHGSNASGKLIFINNTNEEKDLVKGTRIAHESGFIVKTNTRVLIPAKGNKVVDYTMPSKDLYGTIIGERGNIKKDEKFTIIAFPQNIQELVYVKSKNNFLGGKSIWEYKISKEDLEKTKEFLKEEVYQIAENRLNLLLEKHNLNSDYPLKLLTPLKDILSIEIIDYEFKEDPKNLIGKKQGYIDASIKVKIKGYAYSLEYLIGLIESKFKKIAPDNMILSSVNSNNLESFVQKKSSDNSHIKVSFSTRGVYKYDFEYKSDKGKRLLIEASDLILGKNYNDAKNILINNFLEISNVEIELFPFWISKLPVIHEKIVFTIKE